MDTSNEFIVGPNKKLAVKFFMISPFLIALGSVLFLGIIDDTYSIMGITLTSKVAGIILLAVSLPPIATLIITYKTSKRLCLSSDGIKFPTGEFIEWNQISDCDVTRFKVIPVSIIVELHTGTKMAIPWAWVDCGMDDLCDKINDYIQAQN